MTQGAVQIQVTINNKSITIKKNHVMSLNIKRVIGDSANEFTLEAFDETAWQLENALMNSKLAPISVSYSSAKNLTKAIMFSGTCLNYQLSFVGRATMISITGVLSASAGDVDGWWFDTRSVEWVGPMQQKDGVWYVDGKNVNEYSTWESNEDVCAILDFNDGNGGILSTPVVYYNPTRIFKRIIHKYNGSKLGSISAPITNTVASTSNVSNLSKTNTTDTVWNYFRDKGFSEVATAAIMGNINQESGFDPTRLQSGGGPAAGLFQWENYKTNSGRWGSLNKYAIDTNSEWKNLITQLNFAYGEMIGEVNGKPYYDGWMGSVSLNTFKNMDSIDLATQTFERCFERAGVPHMENRIKYARSYLALYQGNSSTSASVITTPTSSASGAVEGWGTGGTGKFNIAEADPSRWIANLPTNQTKETAAQYINRVLCKNAISDTGKATLEEEVAGFRYWVDAAGHHFKQINYDSKNATKLNITYGMQNSQVISFSVSNIGVFAMTGSQVDSEGNSLIDTSSLDYLTGDQITAGGENVMGLQLNQEETKTLAENINWWFSNVQSVNIVSSASKSELSTTLTDTFTKLKDYSYAAELTMWGENSRGFAPGDFIDIIVTGAGGIQHYSSGIYMILSIDDNISQDGYTQTMRLFKVQKSTSQSSSNSGTFVNSTILDSNGNDITNSGSAAVKSTSNVFLYSPNRDKNK